jgi:hypothetical protein
MSVHVVAFVPSASAFPTPLAWAAAIREAGFPFVLDHAFDVFTQVGFLPGQYAGVPAGFEYYCDPVAEYLSEVGHEFSWLQRLRIRRHSFAVAFVTHSRFRDLMASVLASSILTRLSNGLLLDTSSGKCFTSASVLGWAKEQHARLVPLLAEDDA